MIGEATASPTDRCGFELKRADVGADELERDQWHQEIGAVSCYREVWRDGRCIWHADVRGKPADELKAARKQCDGHLDGAVLRQLTLDDAVSFAGASLIGATIKQADLTGADFRDARMVRATVRESDLKGARFDKVILSGSVCSESRFVDASFCNADLRAARFVDADLSGADFTEARLGGGPYEGFYPGANLSDYFVDSNQERSGSNGTSNEETSDQPSSTWNALSDGINSTEDHKSGSANTTWAGYSPPESRRSTADDFRADDQEEHGVATAAAISLGSSVSQSEDSTDSGSINANTGTTDPELPSNPAAESDTPLPDIDRRSGGSEAFDATTHPKYTFYDAFRTASVDEAGVKAPEAPDQEATDGVREDSTADLSDKRHDESPAGQPNDTRAGEAESGSAPESKHSNVIGDASLGSTTSGAESNGSSTRGGSDGTDGSGGDQSIPESAGNASGDEGSPASSDDRFEPDTSRTDEESPDDSQSVAGFSADVTSDRQARSRTDATLGTDTGESTDSSSRKGDGTSCDSDLGADGRSSSNTSLNTEGGPSDEGILGTDAGSAPDVTLGIETDVNADDGEEIDERDGEISLAIDAQLGTVEDSATTAIPDEGVLGASFEDATLEGAVFRDANLGWVSFADATLTGVEFSGVTLAEANFNRATLRMATVADSDLRQTTFDLADLRNAVFDRVDLREASLEYADAGGAKLQELDLRSVSLAGASLPDTILTLVRLNRVSLPADLDLSGATFDRVDLERATLPDLNLRYAQFHGVRLYRARFEKSMLGRVEFNEDTNLNHAEFKAVSLREATVRDSVLYRTRFDSVDLQGASFEDAELTEARFANSRLYKVQFRTCELDNAVIAYCDVRTGAFLNRTNLEAATFRRSDLFGAQFEGCDMHAATFTGGISLRHATFAASALPKSTFVDVDLKKATFDEDLDLSKATLRGVNLPGADLSATDLDGARFLNVVLDGADFSAASLKRAWFDAVAATDASFAGADLSGAVFTDCGSGTTPEPSLRRADFSDATLRGACFRTRTLEGAVFHAANLTGASFDASAVQERPSPEPTNLQGVNLRGADLEDAILDDAILRGANLTSADLSDATARRTDFSRANLHNASLVHVDCRAATFDRALLYETLLTDVQIDTRTSFSRDDPGMTFTARAPDMARCVYEEFRLAPGKLDSDTSQLTAAIWVYRRLEQLHKDNALSSEARTFHISKEEAERHRSRLARDLWLARRIQDDLVPGMSMVRGGGAALASGVSRIGGTLGHLGRAVPFADRVSPSPGFESSTSAAAGLPGIENESRLAWMTKALLRHTTTHGESAWQVVKSSAVVVLISAVAFWLVGIESEDDTVYVLDSVGELATVAGWRDFFLNLYFSLTTFSTIGYGSLSPHGPWSRLIVAVESIAGGVLIALLIFVLGRRVAR